MSGAHQAFADFMRTIAALRHPTTGCPWDREQNHRTLRRYMLEEAYEAADAMSAGDPRAICDELGDVLLQVVLNAQIASDEETFTLEDVIRGIDEKMVRRHPHVFGGAAGKWEEIKAAEKKALPPKAAGTFAEAEKKSPASAQAVKIGKIAKTIKFDWDHPTEVLAQLKSELVELEAEFARKEFDAAKTAAELGDVYFSLAQLCRHLDLDPETVAMDGNKKFLRRFEKLEGIAGAKGKVVAAMARDELEALWAEAKKP